MTINKRLKKFSAFTPKSSDYTNFYFSFEGQNQSEIFNDAEKYYHNITLFVNITSGARLAVAFVEESCDVTYPFLTETRGGEKDYVFNFHSYIVTIRIAGGSFEPDFTNGSYLLIDNGKANNYINEERYDPETCQLLPFISTGLMPVFLGLGILTLLVIFYRKKWP